MSCDGYEKDTKGRAELVRCPAGKIAEFCSMFVLAGGKCGDRTLSNGGAILGAQETAAGDAK
jgi:hypothetical protein